MILTIDAAKMSGKAGLLHRKERFYGSSKKAFNPRKWRVG